MSKRLDPRMSITFKEDVIGPHSARAILDEAPQLVRRAVRRGWMKAPPPLTAQEIKRLLGYR